MARAPPIMAGTSQARLALEAHQRAHSAERPLKARNVYAPAAYMFCVVDESDTRMRRTRRGLAYHGEHGERQPDEVSL